MMLAFGLISFLPFQKTLGDELQLFASRALASTLLFYWNRKTLQLISKWLLN